MIEMKKRILAMMLSLLMLLSLASCSSGDKKDDGKKDDETEYQSFDIAVSTENFSFSRAEVAYAFYQSYNDFKTNNSESVDMYNIDTTATLKDQVYHDDVTWFDYFMDDTLTYVTELCVYCEAAKADGLELDDEDRAQIDASIKTWTDYAENYYYPIDQLLSDFFNTDVTTGVMKSYMEKEALAMKYYNSMVSEMTFTDDELAATVEADRDSFYFIDYIKYVVDENDTENPEEVANKLASAKSEDEFIEMLRDYLINEVGKEEDKVDTDSCYYSFMQRIEGSDFSEWAFGGDAKAGETFIRPNKVEGQYSVYFLLKAPTLEDYHARNIRYITEQIAGHKTFIEAENTLKDILSDWRENDGTEEGFAKLADERIKDESVVKNGGLLENIMKSDESLPEGMADWLYAEDRVPGDTSTFKADSYYIGVVYVGEGEVAWKLTARYAATAGKTKEKFTALKELYPLTVNEEVVKSVDA